MTGDVYAVFCLGWARLAYYVQLIEIVTDNGDQS